MKSFIQQAFKLDFIILAILSLLCFLPSLTFANTNEAVPTLYTEAPEAETVAGNVQASTLYEWVEFTANLNVRVDAGINQTVIKVANLGSLAIIVSAEKQADGIGWYRVMLTDGTWGWVASSYLKFISTVTTQQVSTFSGYSVSDIGSIKIETDLPNKKSTVTLVLKNKNQYFKSFSSTTTSSVIALVAGELGVAVSTVDLIPRLASVIPDVLTKLHVFAKRGNTNNPFVTVQVWEWKVEAEYISSFKEVYESGTPLEAEIVKENFNNDWNEYYKWLNKYILAWKNNTADDYFGTGNSMPARDALIALVASTLKITFSEAKNIMTYDIDNQTNNYFNAYGSASTN